MTVIGGQFSDACEASSRIAKDAAEAASSRTDGSDAQASSTAMTASWVPALYAGQHLKSVMVDHANGAAGTVPDGAEPIALPRERGAFLKFVADWEKKNRKLARTGAFSLLILPIAACSSDPAVQAGPGQGFVVKGPLQGATVYRADDPSVTTTTDANGAFNFDDLPEGGVLVVEGGVDVTTGIDYTGITLLAPSGYSVVSPLSTLVQSLLANDASLSLADAEAVILASFGLPEGTSLSFGQLYIQDENDNWILNPDFEGAAQIQAAQSQSIQLLTQAGGTAEAAQTLAAQILQAYEDNDGELPAGFLDGLIEASRPASPTLDEDVPAFVNAEQAATPVAVEGTATAGHQVTITITDSDGASVTATVTAGENGAFAADMDISGLADGALTVSLVAEDAFGNQSTPQTYETELRTTPPTAPTVTDADSFEFLNAATIDGLTELSGTAQAGSTVVLTVADGSGNTLQATAQAGQDGAFTADVSGWDWSTLDQGPVTLTAVATDQYGNPSTATTFDYVLDTIAPDAPVIDALPDLVNAPTAAELTVTGTAEAGSTVTVTLTDGADGTVTATATANDQGVFSATADITSLADGEIGAVAVATDPAGNSSGQSQAVGAELNTVAPPQPTVTTAPGQFINADGAAAVVLAGTLNLADTDADATQVVITVSNADGQTVLTETVTDFDNGDFTATLDLSGLEDGGLAFTVTAVNAIGNPAAAATIQSMLDTTPPAAPSVDTPDRATLATADDFTVTGTTEANASVTVTLSDGDNDPITATGTADGDGNFSIGLAGVGGLNSGVATISATATDAAGNTSSAGTAQAGLNFQAPGFSEPGADYQFITAANQDAFQVSGTAFPGVDVTVTATDPDGGTVSSTATAGQNGAYTATLDLSGLAQGGSVTLSVADADGNTGAETIDVDFPFIQFTHLLGGSLTTAVSFDASGADTDGDSSFYLVADIDQNTNVEVQNYGANDSIIIVEDTPDPQISIDGQDILIVINNSGAGGQLVTSIRLIDAFGPDDPLFADVEGFNELPLGDIVFVPDLTMFT